MAWIVVPAAVGIGAGSVSGTTTDDFTLPGTQSQKAIDPASPWAAVGVSAFDERVYRTILHQPDSSAADWALLSGASPAQVRESCNRLLHLGLLQPPDSWAGCGRSTRVWRSAR
ncbi:hypothetical protein [Streptomyces sp. ME18-1-4]|uniref:hypothetical protein n=1 Tax=Streptomyces sp. ME18-1-4 TaxID=3028685 RepID=UPI0029B2B942|nr:hypothetical protein [Streptomyces sp. ME18-1-4]MDX3243336.1 hypothetical protein [Streptomyces sp. ME18-1-4]